MATTQSQQPQVTIYTDGSCLGNPGPGGWGAVLSMDGRTRELSGGARHTTNNRMELLAVIEALAALKTRCRVTLRSDSTYVVNPLKVAPALALSAASSQRANPDLWQRLLPLLERHQVTAEWVKGHAGDPGNERANTLATEAAQRGGWDADAGYEPTAATPEPPLTPAPAAAAAPTIAAADPLPAAADSETTLYESAMVYAVNGWQVLPCCFPNAAGGCGCGGTWDRQQQRMVPHTKNDIGKAPLGALVPHGLIDSAGVGQPETIEEWWRRQPLANVGVRTGHVSGIVVVDLDPRHGGTAAFAALVRRNGALPVVPFALTGGGGAHLYFAYPDTPIANSAGKVAEGVDVRGDGGYVLAPPSLHASGRRYQWKRGRSPQEAELAPPPDWLIRLMSKRPQRTDEPTATVAGDDGAPIAEGARNSTLTSHAGAMRRRGMTASEIVGALRVMNNRCNPPLADRDVERIAASVARYAPEAVPAAMAGHGPWIHR